MDEPASQASVDSIIMRGSLCSLTFSRVLISSHKKMPIFTLKAAKRNHNQQRSLLISRLHSASYSVESQVLSISDHR